MPDTQFENGRLRFVTDPSREAEGRLAFLDLLRRTMLDFAIEGDDVTIDSTMLRLPGIGINATRASAFRTLRTRAMAKEADHRALLIFLDGVATISHLGRELAIKAGMATLVSSAEASRVDRGKSRHIIIALPEASLARAASNPDAALMTPMDATAEPFRLLRAYLRLLARNMPTQPDLQRLAASQVRDLVAAAISSASAGAAGPARRAGARDQGRYRTEPCRRCHRASLGAATRRQQPLYPQAVRARGNVAVPVRAGAAPGGGTPHVEQPATRASADQQPRLRCRLRRSLHLQPGVPRALRGHAFGHPQPCRRGAGSPESEADVFWIEVIGFCGSLLAILTYWMREMIPLRIAAVLGCLCFLVYALLIGSYPLILMESTLLPINLYRLAELLRPARSTRA